MREVCTNGVRYWSDNPGIAGYPKNGLDTGQRRACLHNVGNHYEVIANDLDSTADAQVKQFDDYKSADAFAREFCSRT